MRQMAFTLAAMSDREKSFRAPRGTRDILPPESWRWQVIVRRALASFALAGYSPIETPIFEHTEVFERGVGAASDVVTKQMYTFTDRAGRSLTLRPELTAGVVRAVNEHGLARGALPVKVSYAGPMFRQERPQKGRYRQFTQVGIEAMGAEDPTIDAEVIDVAVRFFSEVGLETSLGLNSIGHLDAGCRLGYHKVLVEFLEAHRDSLAPEDRDRIEANPLRTFDSKEERTVAVMADAPLISDHICADCRAHFEAVRGLLDDVGIGYELQPRLVRGLDYYTRTTFEFSARGLGSQDAVGGGGRYDGLSESLAGPPLTGIGFSLGVDRILIALGDALEPAPAIEVYVVALGDVARREAFAIVTGLRRAGIGADLDTLRRGMKGQMKDADRSGARFAAIVGDEELAADEVTLKELASGDQERVAMDRLVRRVRA
jgi:histidyl-tRNA synthetase